MKLTSTAFQHQQRIPAKYTCDGQDINPPLHIAEAPPAAQSLALIMDDPDAPRGTWVHWLVWNMDPKTSEIPEKSVPAGAAQGMTDFHRPSYGGPCPPSGTHRYFFKLYALDTKLNLPAKTDKNALEKAMEKHILARTELVGLYSR